VLAAAVAAASLACRPAPGLGTLVYVRSQVRHAVDLATCSDRVVGPAPSAVTWGPFVSPDGTFRALTRGHAIVALNRRKHRSFTVFRVPPPSTVQFVGWSPDSRWILFAVIPQNSYSLAADGIRLQAVPVDAGGVATVAPMLLYPDYAAWCGGSLVVTAGGDRVATANKHLAVAEAGSWRVRTLASGRSRSWGSVACAPGGRGVVAQSQRATGEDMSRDRSHWALWRVGLDGSQRRLTSPPPGFSDDSPRYVGGTLFFVRSRRGTGAVYALRGGKLLGPFATVGPNPGYYGHRAWPYAVTP
jgi:hypothetical protein